jgi:hypothetical protein
VLVLLHLPEVIKTRFYYIHFLLCSGMNLKSTQDDAYDGNKRRCVSPNNNNETYKRLSSFPS